MKKYSFGISLFLFSLGLVISLFIIFWEPSNQFSECSGKSLAVNKSSIGGDFDLIDKNGNMVNSKDIIVEPTLLYFGYSFCPDICPYDLQRNALTVDILKERNLEVTPVFITIDPDRDTPSRIGEFAEFVHPKMIGLTGTKVQIENVMKKFKIYGKKASAAVSDDYLMDHSTFTYLVHPNLGFLEYFNRKQTAEEMSDVIDCFLRGINSKS